MKLVRAQAELKRNVDLAFNNSSNNASNAGVAPHASEPSDVSNSVRSILFSSPEDGPAVFLTLLKDPNRKVVIMIGHNDAGLFKFPIGEMKLEEMARDCGDAAKMCVFISCDSSEFLGGLAPGVPRRITPIEAVSITRAISQEVHVGHILLDSREHFVQDVTNVTLVSSDHLQVTAQVKTVVYVVGGVAIPGAVLIELDAAVTVTPY
ncbi:MAG: hypothetical protein ACLPN5_03885 [Roseiarcus sp.]